MTESQSLFARLLMPRQKNLLDGKDLQSFCSDIDDGFFHIRQATRHGFPSPPTVLAYDAVQRLLAIGTLTGSILVLGKRSVLTHLDSAKSTENERKSLRFLAFKQGDGLLISIDENNTLVGWNLVNTNADFITDLQMDVSAMDVACNCRWAYVGTLDGSVHIVDSETGHLIKDYVLEYPESTISETIRHFKPVAALSINPQLPHQLLVGYSNGFAAIWDVRQKTILKKFDSNNISWLKYPSAIIQEKRKGLTPSLTCVAWKPDATSFVSGFDNAQFVLWNVKNERKPDLVRYACIDPGSETKERPNLSDISPVYQVIWCASEEQPESTWIFVSGGNPVIDGKGLNGLRIFEYENDKDYSDCRSQQFMSTGEEDLNHLILTPLRLPWYNLSMDPRAVIVISTDGKIFAFDLTQKGFPKFRLPPTLEILNGPKIKCMEFITSLSAENWSSLISPAVHSSETSVAELPMVCGGISGVRIRSQSIEDVINLSDVFLTAHETGIICVWDVSRSIDMEPLEMLMINVGKDYLQAAQIDFMDFFSKSLHLFVALNDGALLIYHFSSSPRSPVELETKSQGIRRFHDARPPGFQLFMIIDPMSDSGLSAFDFVEDANMFALIDKKGNLSIVDLSKSEILYKQQIKISSESDLILFCNFFTLPYTLFENNSLSPTDYCSYLFIGQTSKLTIIQFDNIENIGLEFTKVELPWPDANSAFHLILMNIDGVKLQWEAPLLRKPVDEQAPVKEKKLFNFTLKKSLSKESLKDESLVLSLFVSSQTVRLFQGFIRPTQLFQFSLEGELKIIKSNTVTYLEQKMLFCVLNNCELVILSLPHLKQLARQRLLEKSNLTSNLVNVSDDGRVTVWSSNREFRHFYVFDSENRHKIPSSFGVAHDPMVSMPERPHPLEEGDGGILGAISRKFSNTPWTTTAHWQEITEEMNSLFIAEKPKIGQGKSKEALSERRQLLGDAAGPDEPPEPKKDGSNNAFMNAQAGLAERGEKLKNLDSKFADLAQNSQNFLEYAKELNRREKEKKWYEF